MHTMGMLGMVAGLVGAEGVAVGWVVHLIISIVIRLGYASTFGGLRAGVGGNAGIGLVYGAIWWVLGPLVLMPLLMGMDAFPPIGEDQMMSLVGHLAFGLVLGLASAAVRGRATSTQEASVYSDG